MGGDPLKARAVVQLQAIALMAGLLLQVAARGDGQGAGGLRVAAIALPIDDAGDILRLRETAPDHRGALSGLLEPEVARLGLPVQLLAVDKLELVTAG